MRTLKQIATITVPTGHSLSELSGRRVYCLYSQDDKTFVSYRLANGDHGQGWVPSEFLQFPVKRSAPVQTKIEPTETETLQQAVRNVITVLGRDATRQRVFEHLCRCMHIKGNLDTFVSEIDLMEFTGQITMTSTGAYVVGRHKLPDAEDLELVSCDSSYGQPRLF